jgi:hypothetical protein
VDLHEKASAIRASTEWNLHLITNVTFYVYKLLNMGKVGCGGTIPKFIESNRHILALGINRVTSRDYDDNLCFFRCLDVTLACECQRKCVCRRVRDKCAKALLYNYVSYAGMTYTFPGVDCRDLMSLEKCFYVNVVALRPEDGGRSNVVWTSSRRRVRTMYVNPHDKHFGLIKNIDGYARAYSCLTCESSYTRLGNLKRQNCRSDRALTYTYPGGEFGPPLTVFTRLKDLANIDVTDPALLLVLPIRHNLRHRVFHAHQ